ncbi:hypothetical protein Pan216_42980 [Planctomycetes bacterium Pan216]|uniref:HEAT repeat protein n=1 Tax=Kolteria novifilia TaxID=2527975 RepID=A0A518B8W9_9BACT|nr:hypothetical protein Pan216_42980 [Planctomycetes bacterium Pan216]
MRHIRQPCLMLAAAILCGVLAQPALAQTASAASAAGGSSDQVTSLAGLLKKLPSCLAKAKAALCASCLGQMIDAMLAPINMATGGCINCCNKPPNKQQLAQPGAAGTCAQITKDSIDAAERIESIRCMASADCNYWPEIEKAFIESLRADRNECVRLYAAIALGNGCCCTEKTVKALKLTATGGDSDGNPAEASPRVRAAALQAMNNCTRFYGILAPQEPPEKPSGAEPPSPVPTPGASGETASAGSYYDGLNEKSLEESLAEARQAIETVPAMPPKRPETMFARLAPRIPGSPARLDHDREAERALREAVREPAAPTDAKGWSVFGILAEVAKRSPNPQAPQPAVVQVSYQQPVKREPSRLKRFFKRLPFVGHKDESPRPAPAQ